MSSTATLLDIVAFTLSVFVLGVLVGYGIRSLISQRRRRAFERVRGSQH